MDRRKILEGEAAKKLWIRGQTPQDEHRGYHQVSNLPSRTEVEDAVKSAVDYWPRSKQLIALKYLYVLCGCKIDDLSREIEKAERSEKGV